MYKFRQRRLLDFLGLKFWLPLPLLALLFWATGKVIANYRLEHAYSTSSKIETPRSNPKPARKVSAIQIKIKKDRGIAWVQVNTLDSDVKELEFEFTTTEPKEIEAAIASELGLPLERVKDLARYRASSPHK